MSEVVKAYSIKTSRIFDPSTTVKTISFGGNSKDSKSIKSDITFDQKIDGGLGALVLQINTDFDDDIYRMSDLIRVFVYTTKFPKGKQIYFGFVQNFDKFISQSGQGINLSCLGISSLMVDIKYKSGGSRVFSKNDDPTNIFADIIDSFNASYALPLLTVASNPLFGTLINKSFDNVNCLTALNIIRDATGWQFFIDGEGVASFGPMHTVPDNKIKLIKEAINLDLGNDRIDVVNKLYLTRSGGIEKTYEDIISQNEHGLKEETIVDDTILDETTQDEFGDNYILENKQPKQQLRFEVNDKVEFSEIIPGNLVRITNTNSDIEDARIVRVSYSTTTLKIDCEKSETLGDTIVNA